MLKILKRNDYLWNKLFLAIFFTFLFAIIYMFFEDSEFISRDEKLEEFEMIHNKFLHRLYFSVITQTTIGYGDIVPNSSRVRFAAALQALSILLLIVI